nr:putative F-box protein At3g52320 [Ipomoea batatas]
MNASKKAAGVSIPQEIVFKILSKLPAKTLVQFRCVSKPFCALIADHGFGVVHRSLSLTLPSRAGVLISIASPATRPRSFYTLNFTPRRQGMLQANRVGFPDAKSFLCSSSFDGLFICMSRPNGAFTVCNVSTGQRIFLPRLIEYEECELLMGYDSESKRYKVLMTACRGTISRGRLIRGGFEYKHWVFTVGVDKSWREINNYGSRPFFPFEGNRYPYYFSTNVYIDGIIYSYTSLTKHNMILRNHIVAFEVGCESFSVITLPDKVSSLSWFFLRMSALLEVGGRLAMVHVSVPDELRGEGLCYMNIWTWEKSKECWEEITMTIPLKWSRMINNSARLLRFATNHDGEIVLLCVFIKKFYILVCNLRSEAWRKFDVSGLEDSPLGNSWDFTMHNLVDHVFPLE